MQDLKTWEKGEADYVTAVDEEMEVFFKKRLQEILPGSSFLGEEGGLRGDLNGNVWVVDPLDGTTNFSRGLKPFAFSVALMEERKPVLGVTGVPPYRWLLSGAKGIGARLNSKPVEPLSDKELDVRAVVCVGIIKKEEIRAWVEKIAGSRAKLRFLGSAVTHLASVILGRIELAVQERAHIWDIAASLPILEEVGGRMVRLDGSPIEPFNEREMNGEKLSFLAGSGKAVISALKLLVTPS